MTRRRRTVCKAGKHDLTDPENVGESVRRNGRVNRYCKPCHLKRCRDWKRKRREATLPGGRRPVLDSELRVLQAIADGLSLEEITDRDGLTLGSVRTHLYRLRGRYGVASTAAAVAAGLARGDIKPVRHGPFPPRNNITRDHTRSLLRLVRGDREPCRGPGAEPHARMMDDLYAWSEPHAVSVLWAAGIITAADLPERLKKEQPAMIRAVQYAPAT